MAYPPDPIIIDDDRPPPSGSLPDTATQDDEQGDVSEASKVGRDGGESHA